MRTLLGSSTGKAISRTGLRFSSTAKAIPPQHFAFPSRQKRFPPQHFAFPPRQKRFPRSILLFLRGKSVFPRSILFFLHGKSVFPDNLSLVSETPVLARRNHREFEFPGCIGRCVYAKADAVPRILSAQAAIGTFEGIVMAFCGRSSCVRFPYITGGQR